MKPAKEMKDIAEAVINEGEINKEVAKKITTAAEFGKFNVVLEGLSAADEQRLQRLGYSVERTARTVTIGWSGIASV